ncbi:MAG TPA: DUF507 family protein [Polyangiaceae bacterium]|nr:DUF507 family protein [Polyangiaceae bacterium]
MRLHGPRVPQIAQEMMTALVKGKDIETESPAEVKADIEAVLSQYVRDEQAVSERAKDMMAQRGLSQNEYPRLRKMIADEKHIKLGDDAIDYLLDQLVEMLMHSANVDEVFSEDYELRRKMRDPLRKQLAEEQALEQEIRGHLRHVQEGTGLWEVEYRRMMEDIKRRKGL